MDKHEQSVVAIPPKTDKRRSFTGPFKRQLVEQTLRTDVSVAGVALANGLNTNLLARWRRDYLMAQATGSTPALIPVHVVDHVPATSPAQARLLRTPNIPNTPNDGEIEIRRNDMTVVIRGAPDQAVLGVLLRELLKFGPGSSR